MPKKKITPVKYSAVDKTYSKDKCVLCGEVPNEEVLCKKCKRCSSCCECAEKQAKQ